MLRGNTGQSQVEWIAAAYLRNPPPPLLGYYVARKHVTTVRNEHMNFGTWLDRDGLFFDSTHFPPSLAKYPFRGKGIYLMTGKIVLDFDFPMLEVDVMEKLPMVKDERY